MSLPTVALSRRSVLTSSAVASLGVVAGALAPPGAAAATTTTTTAMTTTAAGSSSGPTGARRFSQPLRVTNRFTPLVPGRQFRYVGQVSGEGRHEDVFTVTDLTLTVHGVPVVVALDQDYRNGRLEEAELAFFAQDDAGNVWNLGEYPEEYDNGTFTGAPSTWVDGVRGAQGGFKLPAHPRLRQTWTEGRAKAIDFWDVSRVAAVGANVRSGLGVHHGVVEVDETSPLDPASGHQLKFYAPHVGLIRVEARGGQAREDLSLVSLRNLSSHAMGDARRIVTRMDRRGRAVSRDYRTLGPLHRRCDR